MKNRFIKISLACFIIIVALFSANYYFSPKNAVKLILPDFASLSYLEANLENDTTFLTLFGLVQNESFFDLNIDSISYNINLEGENILQETDPVNLKLKPEELDSVRLNIKLPVKKIKFISRQIKSNDSLNIGAVFHIYYQYLNKPFKLTFRKKQTIESPIPPEIKITEIKRNEVTKFGKEVVVDVSILVSNNSKQITFDLEDIHYKISLGEHINGKGIIKNKLVIKPGESEEIIVPVSLKVEKPIRTAIDLFWNKEEVFYEVEIVGLLNNEKVKSIDKPLLKFSAKGITKINE